LVWWKRTGFGWLLLQSATLCVTGVVAGLGTALLQSRHSSWTVVLIEQGGVFVAITVGVAVWAWRRIGRADRGRVRS
jgi:hypothetical protein